MPASPFDSALYRDLFHDAEIARLLSESAEIRAMLIFEGRLARVQGALGMIPEVSAAAIERASMEVEIDPGALAAETGRSAVPVPALVQAFREAMQAPEHAQYVHWGATSQDIVDTGLVLRTRQILAIFEARLKQTVQALGQLAETYADLPMAGRTYMQAATPVSFGAVAAGWGRPLADELERMPWLREQVLKVSLAGAAGNLSAMGDKGTDMRAGLAQALELGDPGGPWHSDRASMVDLSQWCARVAIHLSKLGEDLTLMTQTGIGEVTLGASGGSSTMPQKANPVQPSILVALARLVAGLTSVVQTTHRQQRDGASWFAEWLSLGQILMATGRGLAVAGEMLPAIAPRPDAMARGIDDGLGLIYAEALSFALAPNLGRPEAQAQVKALALRARAEGRPLAHLVAEAFPDQDLAPIFAPGSRLGTGPAEAHDFAKRSKSFS